MLPFISTACSPVLNLMPPPALYSNTCTTTQADHFPATLAVFLRTALNRTPAMNHLLTLSLFLSLARTQDPAAVTCASTSSSTFTITPLIVRSKRQQPIDTLAYSLMAGVLTDQVGRKGYIANDFRLQFDVDSIRHPGARVVDGWEVCSNDLLSLQGSTAFYQCRQGSNYHFFTRPVNGECIPITIQAINFMPRSIVSATLRATSAVILSTGSATTLLPTASSTAINTTP